MARLWRRDLASYPEAARRYTYLAITVITTITLYYLLYIQYAVATSIIQHYNMTFTYFVYMSVIANAVGAGASLIAGLADRFGRANLVVYGLAVAAVLVIILPSAPSKTAYVALFSGLSFVEGMLLVATPALVRDFSPQLGRATAMGTWTIGPVVGSLVVTTVTSHPLSTHTWQDEIHYAGYTAVVVFILALVGLRELAPRLRDQIMVSMRDRALIEARARGIDPEAELAGGWKQMLNLRIVGPAFAISIYLLLYYALVGNLVVYFSSVFGYTEQRANAVANWYWASNAVSLIVAGVISDKLRVRKPLMILGGVASLVTTGIFATLATHPDTSYYTFATLFLIGGAVGGITYAPWMALFTENVEERNPAATATGLAVWGWIIRIVVAVSAAILPHVVTSVTPIVDHGAEVAAASQQAGPALAIVQAHPETFAKLAAYPDPTKIPPDVLAAAAQDVGGVDKLLLVNQARPQLAILQAHGTEVQKAVKDIPGQWKTWWWVCLAGQIVFLPFVFMMRGRWNPAKAKQDAAEHEAAVQREMERLGTAQPLQGDTA